MNLTLTKDTQQDLNDIRELIVKKDYQAFRSDRNRLKLSEVYREVMAFSGFKVEGIQASCSGCLNDPVNVVHNYIMNYEQQPDNREAKVIEVAGGKLPTVQPEDGEVTGIVAHKEGENIKKREPRFRYDVSDLEKYADASLIKKLPEEMEYSELMELAKHHGHTGKRISKEALIEFIENKESE